MADNETESDDIVTVVYALADEQHIVAVEHVPGMTARTALDCSGLRERFPEIDNSENSFGTFGHPLDPDQLIEPGTRVEICRPLQRDPRELRRIMASLGLVMGQREK